MLKYQGILPPLPPPPTCLVIIHKRPSPLFIYIVLCLFFQVGCGAIGCELLKNFALLGIAGSANGMVVFIFILHSVACSNYFLFKTQFAILSFEQFLFVVFKIIT